MERPVCLVPSKEGQCTLLAGHTGFPHQSSKGYEWYEPGEEKRKPGRPKKFVV